MASHIAGRARVLRRSLRDYQRREYAQIRMLEERSRGLRLYAAWSRKEKASCIREVPEGWRSAEITTGTFHENLNAAA